MRLERLKSSVTAKKLWQAGLEIGLIGNKCVVGSQWSSIGWGQKDEYVESIELYWRNIRGWAELGIELAAWEKFYNSWNYYLTPEEGTYAHYYVKRGEYEEYKERSKE